MGANLSGKIAVTFSPAASLIRYSVLRTAARTRKIVPSRRYVSNGYLVSGPQPQRVISIGKGSTPYPGSLVTSPTLHKEKTEPWYRMRGIGRGARGVADSPPVLRITE